MRSAIGGLTLESLAQPITTKPLYKWLLGLLVMVVFATGCTDCREETVNSTRAGEFEIKLNHRVCGSVAAYTISIAPPGTNTTGRADQFEPFMMVCDCYQPINPPPVAIRMLSPSVVVIRYDTARLWRIEKRRMQQGEFRIIYEQIAR